MKKLILLLYSLLFTLTTEGKSGRIQVIEYSLDDIGKIYIAPGRTSTIEFPCEITRIVTSPAGDYSASFDVDDNPMGVDLWLSSSASQPTDFKVKCINNDFYVFDIIPSLKNHHELIKIKRVKNRPTIHPIKTGKLLQSSEFKSESSNIRLLRKKVKSDFEGVKIQ